MRLVSTLVLLLCVLLLPHVAFGISFWSRTAGSMGDGPWYVNGTLVPGTDDLNELYLPRTTSTEPFEVRRGGRTGIMRPTEPPGYCQWGANGCESFAVRRQDKVVLRQVDGTAVKPPLVLLETGQVFDVYVLEPDSTLVPLSEDEADAVYDETNNRHTLQSLRGEKDDLIGLQVQSTRVFYSCPIYELDALLELLQTNTVSPLVSDIVVTVMTRFLRTCNLMDEEVVHLVTAIDQLVCAALQPSMRIPTHVAYAGTGTLLEDTERHQYEFTVDSPTAAACAAMYVIHGLKVTQQQVVDTTFMANQAILVRGNGTLAYRDDMGWQFQEFTRLWPDTYQEPRNRIVIDNNTSLQLYVFSRANVAVNGYKGVGRFLINVVYVLAMMSLLMSTVWLVYNAQEKYTIWI